MPKKDSNSLQYRAAGFRAGGVNVTLDRDKRTMELVISTETPVLMWDYEQGDYVPEVLLAKGAIMPKQVPLLDTHSRYGVSSVLGSVTGKRVDGAAVLGLARFSSVKEGEEAMTKYEEGHLTDFSAGYAVNNVTRVRKGEKAEIGGRTWKGPVNVATSWTIKEVSCCPIGADPKAKGRAADNDNNHHQEDEPMPETKERMDNLENLVSSLAGSVSTLAESVKASTDKQRADQDADAQIEQLRTDKVRQGELTVEKERQRIRAIDEMTEKLGASTGIDFEDLRASLIQDGTNETDAYKRCLDRIAAARPEDLTGGLRISVGREDKEKSRAAAVDGMLLRSGVALGSVQDKDTEYQQFTMFELAKNRMACFGQSMRGMDKMQIFERALSTSDFSAILADVANKALLDGFDAAEETYAEWCDTSGRVNDFKPHVFARASEAPSLIEINPDGGEYKYGKMGDTKETVAVTDHGIIVPFTRAAMVNDDLGALQDIREKLGVAAARKYGDLAYAVLTGNPAMGDGTVLFHADHANLAASAAAPSVAALNVGAAAMATQKDIMGVQNLNLRPIFVLSPWALKGTVDNLLTSTTPIAPGSAASPVMNPWSYLKPVYEARLDANSATAWYLMARRGMTVKLFTLNGQMAPVLETKSGWATDGMEFKARITAAAKAMDYRGAFKNSGA